MKACLQRLIPTVKSMHNRVCENNDDADGDDDDDEDDNDDDNENDLVSHFSRH